MADVFKTSVKKKKQGVCGVCNGCPNGWHGRGNVWPIMPSAWGAATLGRSVATLEAQEEGVVSIWAPILRISNVHTPMDTAQWILMAGPPQGQRLRSVIPGRKTLSDSFLCIQLKKKTAMEGGRQGENAFACTSVGEGWLPHGPRSSKRLILCFYNIPN